MKTELDAFRFVRENYAVQEGHIKTLHDQLSSASSRENEALATFESVRGKLDSERHSLQVSQASLSEFRDATQRARVILEATPGAMSDIIETEISSVQACIRDKISQSLAEVIRRLRDVSSC